MDVIFLYSNEGNWEKNLLNLRLVVGHNSAIIPVDAKGCNKHEAFKKVANTFNDPNHRFILVEGDNWVFPEFVELLHIEQNGPHRTAAAQIVDQVAKIDIEHGTNADKMAESGLIKSGMI